MADSPVSTLLPLFKKRYPDFQDFQQGDPKFIEEEDYKREILASWEAADGVSEIRKLVAEGRGLDALKFLRKAAKFGMKYHPIGRYDIPSELEKDEQQLVLLFKKLEEATSDEEREPMHCINSLLARIRHKEVPMTWSLFYFLLWLYRPKDFFPVKITIIRAVADKCNFEIQSGAFNEDAVGQIYEFVLKVYEELEPYKPRDLLDANPLFGAATAKCKAPTNYTNSGMNSSNNGRSNGCGK
jgi:hypothetical protein